MQMGWMQSTTNQDDLCEFWYAATERQYWKFNYIMRRAESANKPCEVMRYSDILMGAVWDKITLKWLIA